MPSCPCYNYYMYPELCICQLYVEHVHKSLIYVNLQKAEAEKLKTTIKDLQKQEEDFRKKEEEIAKRERVSY